MFTADTMLEIRNFKKEMVRLTDNKVLSKPYIDRLNAIRGFLIVVEECRPWTSKGFPEDWIQHKIIKEKMAEKGYKFGTGEITKAFLSILPDVAKKDDNKRSLSHLVWSNIINPKHEHYNTYFGFVLRRGNGKLHFFSRYRWTKIWKNIYFPLINNDEY